MRYAFPALALLAAALFSGGCSRPEAESSIQAQCEKMAALDEETPMEEMPDDDQGIIYF